MNIFLSRLDSAINDEWEHIKNGNFWRRVISEPVDTRLYKLMMEQVYHYTKHNSVNQAAAAYKTCTNNKKLLQFVYKHAAEELGHEGMVIHDLQSINAYESGFEMQTPLPPTQALVAFLYHVALEKGAVPRLGYSYWAESCYGHIDPILKKFAMDLGLTDTNMSFFVAHSEIDARHSKEVIEAISFCNIDAQDEDEIINVATTTLYLTGQILEAVYRRYQETISL